MLCVDKESMLSKSGGTANYARHLQAHHPKEYELETLNQRLSSGKHSFKWSCLVTLLLNPPKHHSTGNTRKRRKGTEFEVANHKHSDHIRAAKRNVMVMNGGDIVLEEETEVDGALDDSEILFHPVNGEEEDIGAEDEPCNVEAELDKLKLQKMRLEVYKLKLEALKLERELQLPRSQYTGDV